MPKTSFHIALLLIGPAALPGQEDYLNHKVINPTANSVASVWFHLFGQQPNFTGLAKTDPSYQRANEFQRDKVMKVLLDGAMQIYRMTPEGVWFRSQQTVTLGTYDMKAKAFPITLTRPSLARWAQVAWGQLVHGRPTGRAMRFVRGQPIVELLLGSGRSGLASKGQLPKAMATLPMAPDKAEALLNRNQSRTLTAQLILQPVNLWVSAKRYMVLARPVHMKLLEAKDQEVAQLKAEPFSKATLDYELSWRRAPVTNKAFDSAMRAWLHMRGEKVELATLTKNAEQLNAPAHLRERLSESSLRARFLSAPPTRMVHWDNCMLFYSKPLKKLVTRLREANLPMRVVGQLVPLPKEGVFDPDAIHLRIKIPANVGANMELNDAAKKLGFRISNGMQKHDVFRTTQSRVLWLLKPVRAELEPLNPKKQGALPSRVLYLEAIAARAYSRRRNRSGTTPMLFEVKL